MFPNWFKDVERYFKHVPEGPLRALQIGTYTGDATQWLLNNREVEFIHDVDTWEGSNEPIHSSLNFSSIEEYYDSRFKDVSQVTKYKMTSDEFFSTSTSSYNFVYVDGDHTAMQTALDGLNAFRVLEVGGVIAFDDYEWRNGSEFLEPKLGVDAVLSICKDKIKILEKEYQVWFKKC